MSVHAGADDFIMSLLSLQTVIQAHFPCREKGRQEHRQANWFQSQLTELTNPATSVVSAPWVSFSLSGWPCLPCGFRCLFSPRGTVSVPGCGCSATRRFGRGGQSGTLLFFSLSVPRSHLDSPGEGFSITPLWADQSKQGGKVWYLEVKVEFERKIKYAHLRKQMHNWTCRQAKKEILKD